MALCGPGHIRMCSGLCSGPQQWGPEKVFCLLRIQQHSATRQLVDLFKNIFFIALSPFLIRRMFVREPSWEYSANLVGS